MAPMRLPLLTNGSSDVAETCETAVGSSLRQPSRLVRCHGAGMLGTARCRRALEPNSTGKTVDGVTPSRLCPMTIEGRVIKNGRSRCRSIIASASALVLVYSATCMSEGGTSSVNDARRSGSATVSCTHKEKSLQVRCRKVSAITATVPLMLVSRAVRTERNDVCAAA